jgi:hypothetical protein
MWSHAYGVVENQALITQLYYTDSAQDDLWSSILMDYLEQGYTAVEARNHLCEEGVAQSVRFSFELELDYIYYSDPDQLPLFGDYYTRIRGVYTGDDTNRGLNWL